jgi:hypothetical protein
MAVFLASFLLYLTGFYHFSSGIKSSNSKEKPRKSHNQKNAGDCAVSSLESRRLDRIHKTISSRFPSVTDIAIIAAILSTGEQFSGHPNRILPETALSLWEACKEEREHRIEFLTLRSFAQKKDTPPELLPNPKKYPVGLDEFLRLALPKKRPADRMKLYRESLRLDIRHTRSYQRLGGVVPIESVPIPSDSEVADVIARHRETGFDESQFQPCLITLRKFADWEQRQNRKKRAKAGSAKRWAKKVQTNPFSELY